MGSRRGIELPVNAMILGGFFWYPLLGQGPPPTSAVHALPDKVGFVLRDNIDWCPPDVIRVNAFMNESVSNE